MKDAMVAREDMEVAKSQPPKKYERRHGSQRMPSINRQISMKDAMVAREDMEDAKY